MEFQTNLTTTTTTFNCQIATVSSGQYNDCSIPNICSGTTIVATTCLSATTDTTLGLYNINGDRVSYNDDNLYDNGYSSCYRGSYLYYKSTETTCQTFTVKLSCYSGTCTNIVTSGK